MRIKWTSTYFASQSVTLQHFFRYYGIMEACIQQSSVAQDLKSLYHLRYFYVDEGGTGRYTCGVAFESTMTLFSKYKFDKFCDEENGIRQWSGPPRTQSFKDIWRSIFVSVAYLAMVYRWSTQILIRWIVLCSRINQAGRIGS